MAFTNCLAPLATNTKAISCPEVEFIFARGSGQELNAKDYQAWKSSLEYAIKQYQPNLRYRFYELGTKKHGGAQYEAVKLDFEVGTSAVFSAGESYEFGRSVESGITELKNYTRESSSSCKGTKFVLAGYSQGAMVISKALPELDSSKIIFAGTFGDPKLYLPEGKGIVPDACKGKNFSEYRYFAPNCRTHKGLLGALNPYRPSSQYLGKIGIWCDNNDPICGGGLKPTDAMGSHTSYHTSGQYEVFADVVMEKISPKSMPNRDTIILLDTTNSMKDSLKKYSNRILSQIEAVAKNSRIAFYAYGDLKEGIKTKQLLDFGSSFSDFKQAFLNLDFTDGGDEPESTLSAILTAMNSQRWRTNAVKSLILITDAGFHNPDFDDTTLQKVVDRSIEIDPVNIYLVSAGPHLDIYNDLLFGTSGKRLFLSDNLDLSPVYERDNITFVSSNYQAITGQPITFQINAPKSKLYEWDLDFDGIFEVKTTVPEVTHTYTSEVSGFIQAKATNTSGYLSSGSSRISVTKPETPASIFNFSSEREGTTAKVSFKVKNSPLAAIVVDDALVSIVKTDIDNYLTITDLLPNSIISIVPISESGFYGETISESRDRGDENAIEASKLLVPNCGRQ